VRGCAEEDLNKRLSGRCNVKGFCGLRKHFFFCMACVCILHWDGAFGKWKSWKRRKVMEACRLRETFFSLEGCLCLVGGRGLGVDFNVIVPSMTTGRRHPTKIYHIERDTPCFNDIRFEFLAFQCDVFTELG
jgi:hypothetical protein